MSKLLNRSNRERYNIIFYLNILTQGISTILIVILFNKLLM